MKSRKHFWDATRISPGPLKKRNLVPPLFEERG
jgi:hypothetical protein